MIEVLTSESGHKVFRADGKLLASRFDPGREAIDWVQVRQTFIKDVSSVIVLGMGSGYHLLELRKQTSAKIIAIDFNLDVYEEVQRLHKFDSISSHYFETVSQMKQDGEIRKAITCSFVVCAHFPSFALCPKVYGEAHALLLARDWGSLNWQWQIRGGPSFDSSPTIKVSEQPLSIHDLGQTELVQDSSERERMLFKALRELVK